MTLKSFKRSSITNSVNYKSILAGNYPTIDTFTSTANHPNTGASGATAFGQYNGALYNWGSYESNGSVYKYVISTNTWSTPYTGMPVGYFPWGFQNLNSDGKIWAIQCGRTNNGGNGNHTLYYDAVANSYTTKANSPTEGRRGRGSMNAAGTLGYYHVGYDTNAGFSASVYRYNVSSNNYTTMASYPIATYDLGWGHDGVNDNIYAIYGGSSGGFAGTYYYYMYSVSANTWTAKTAPTATNGGSGVYLDNKMYHLGNTSNYMSIYDIPGNTWSIGVRANPVTSTQGSAVATDGTYVYTWANDTVNTSRYQR
jgi:hypothetical protein